MKTIIIIVALVILGVIAFLVIHALGPAAGPSTAGSGNPAAAQTVPVLSVVSSTPQGASFTLGTSKGNVEVKNFYLADPPVDQDGTLVIASASDYYITYDIPTSDFGIIISGTSFDAARPGAESAFLALLGISQNDACKLDVTELVPYQAGDPLDGESFPLSFCAAGM